MDMRSLIDAVIILSEAAVKRVDVGGTEVRVWKNPSHDLFAKLVTTYQPLRGSIDIQGNLFVWDAAIAIHSSIETALGLDVSERMMMTSGDVTLEYDVDDDAFRSIPSISRAYGNWGFDIYNDSVVDDDIDDDDDYL